MIVNGMEIRNNLLANYRQEILENNYKIKLAIICIGSDEASKIYVKNKKKVCDLVGIECDIYSYCSISRNELEELIDKLNHDDSVTGIMIELPLPLEFDSKEIIELIDPNKDVDGLTKNSVVLPCTALSVLEIFKYYNVDLNNKKITLIGYSNLIGKPLEKFFLSKKYDVTVCNSKTLNLEKYTTISDIIITATGVYGLLNKEMFKENVIIIDCGIIRKNNKLYGDVDFNGIMDKAKLITPVPNGVGPVTTAMVIRNLLYLYKNIDVTSKHK